ncbi:hypothetical protein PF010_g11497 [Phytophthora fragariae]|uniref:Uncharacterized protein n=1 Tax=Phytophthora fragariae TaxID=53985 RepID=A0A6G0L6F5_9STRA|nr:hypothetical protein PF010_g11497 [Phytophthora fragariae]
MLARQGPSAAGLKSCWGPTPSGYHSTHGYTRCGDGPTPPDQQGVPVPVPQGGQGAGLQAQGCAIPQDKGVDYPIKDNVDIKDQVESNLLRASVSSNKCRLSSQGARLGGPTGIRECTLLKAPIVSSGVQVQTEPPQPQGQSSLEGGRGHGQPTQSGQGQQGLGRYGPQLSYPYQGQ